MNRPKPAARILPKLCARDWRKLEAARYSLDKGAKRLVLARRGIGIVQHPPQDIVFPVRWKEIRWMGGGARQGNECDLPSSDPGHDQRARLIQIRLITSSLEESWPARQTQSGHQRGSLIPTQQTRSVFHRPLQRTASRRRDKRGQSAYLCFTSPVVPLTMTSPALVSQSQ